MASNKQEDWETSVSLEPGSYEYKFVVDGRSICDPACSETSTHRCPTCVTNSFGSMNKVRTVR